MRYLMLFAVLMFQPAGMVTAVASPYDTVVLADRPVLYLGLSGSDPALIEPDKSGFGRHGRYFPGPISRKSRMPNGDRAVVFNGYTQYVEVASHPALSVPPGGVLTIEAWIRPETLDFPSDESDGYVHWAGKGESGQQEYALRMYSRRNSANRPNRISGYAFNLDGGLGSGSYFQDAVTVGEWIHVVFTIDTIVAPGSVRLYKNAVLRKTTPLSQFNVFPGAGLASLRIGTRDLGSFFKGAIGKFAVYPHALSAGRLQAHFRAMWQ